MRLKSVKLSGFKSFVDPTSISFPHDLTAIVGPNGCGKSNVIDAVRWVLGESSAKNLRSQSMSEVVFNGSASRKPVSRASVELFFDNHDGRIGGEFADYSEISVRRTLDIDSQSNYYLNGTSCRKRDITDLILGTGLGPRSYAIIEQDMISTLVSSKPEEMRSYIEEVAGISRYLERRKETESRIKRTKENLSRLEDLREEIGRLLFKLKQQARAAERYADLRKEENHTKGLVWSNQWQDKANEVLIKEKKVRLQKIDLEEINSLKTTSDSEINEFRAKQMELQTEMDKVQQEFYSLGADISRQEQEIKQNKNKTLEVASKLGESKDTLSSKKNEVAKSSEQIERLEESISLITPELEQLREKQLQENSQDSEIEEIEMDWDNFSNDLINLLDKLRKAEAELLSLMASGKVSKENVLHDTGLKEVEGSLDSLSSIPLTLVDKTKRLFKGSTKEERLELLDKTQEYADSQAKLATNISQINHLKTEISTLESEIISLEGQAFSNKEPLKAMEDSLKGLLQSRLAVEERMGSIRKSIDDASDSIRNTEKEKLDKEQKAINSREVLETLRLDHQASRMEAENIEKQIKENNLDIKKLLSELDEDKTVSDYQMDLEKIERKISRLGAINLAAMEEYAQEEKRKTHLDKQHEELMRALETLQNAINKIDKETRTTFKDTFDDLNKSLAKSFPKLFGGGHAELILLDDDLLTAGVGIAAKPPGKKNTSITQLSGGEKALTAIALVFAFFELNPAPFCMLDEVDAPLDDLNTMRFISLVEEMSDKVQFVYITHNKISMEKSKHLMGVTMQEPGVSKMVAVDVEEAIKLAATA